MNKSILYKDIKFYMSFCIEALAEKLHYLFHVTLNEDNKLYRLSFIVDEESSNKYSIDIYINSTEKKLLFDTILNILHGNIESTELLFSNKLDCHNRVFYKLSQFINTECNEYSTINMSMKLKIYRDKNFVIIEPKVSYSYLPIKIKDIDSDIFPVLLSEHSIEEIKNSCEES